MAIKMTVIDKIDVAGNVAKIANNDQFWTFAAQQWHKLIEPFTPMRTGALASRTVNFQPKEIHYGVPYDKRMYFGNKFNFSKEMHPKATAEWDKAAEPTEKSKLISTLQRYINGGGLDKK